LSWIPAIIFPDHQTTPTLLAPFDHVAPNTSMASKVKSTSSLAKKKLNGQSKISLAQPEKSSALPNNYIPDTPVHLCLPQTYFQKGNPAGSFRMDSYLTYKDGTTLEFPYNAGSMLPLLLTTNNCFKQTITFVGVSYADTQ
jgi:hypothetical protein